MQTAGAGNTYQGASAGGAARQHNGDVYNSTDHRSTDPRHFMEKLTNVLDTSYHYTARKRRSDETLRDDQRSQALLKAAAEGQLPRVKYLLRLGVDLDHTDESGFTALHHAAFSGFEDCLNVLIDAGADVNAQSHDYGTPLCLAATKGRLKVIDQLLLPRASIEATGGLLGSALHAACCCGETGAVKALLSSHAEADQSRFVTPSAINALRAGRLEGTVGSDERHLRGTPLHLAAQGGHNGCINELVSRHVNINAMSLANSEGIANSCGALQFPGTTALMRSAANHHGQTVRLLCSLGASTEMKDFEGNTALHYAAMKGDVSCLEELLTAGAHIDATNSGGTNPLILAATCGHAGFIRALLRARATLAIVTDKGESALMWAAAGGHEDCVLALLEAGQAPNGQDIHGATALHFAVGINASELASFRVDEAVIRILIKAGADREVQTDKGQTPLHVCATGNRAKALKVLLDSGATAAAIDRAGKTPLMLAYYMGFESCIQLLSKSDKALASTSWRQTRGSSTNSVAAPAAALATKRQQVDDVELLAPLTLAENPNSAHVSVQHVSLPTKHEQIAEASTVRSLVSPHRHSQNNVKLGMLRSVKNVIKLYSTVQVKLRDATSNKHEDPTLEELSDIARITSMSSIDFYDVVDMLEKRLNDNGENWRHVLKSLRTLDYCIHKGEEYFVTWARQKRLMLGALQRFDYIDDEGRDVGSLIRTSATELMSLLMDEQRMGAERAQQGSWKSVVASVWDKD